MKKQYIIPIFIPYTGDEGKYTIDTQNLDNSKKEMITKEDLQKIIEEQLNIVKDEKDICIEVSFIGGNFTALDIETQKDFLEVIYKYVEEKKIDSIKISTTPNYINKDVLKLLKKYKVQTIELEIQSANDYILKKSNRQYNFKQVKKASKLIRLYGFKLAHQMIIGLPESTRIDEINTAKALIKLKPKIVRIETILVIKGTELEKEYNEEIYQPLTVTQAVEIIKELIQMFKLKKIDVIRSGLQNEDAILDLKEDASKIIAGPYHPAFEQLVESAMWYDAIVYKIKKLNVKVKEVEVTVNSVDSDNVIGYKKENIEKLKLLYDVDLIVKSDENLKQGKSQIVITKTYTDFLE